MQALSQLNKMFEFITIDFIINLAPYKSIVIGKVTNNLLIIVNKYSKDVEYIFCFKTIDALELARLFIIYWFKNHKPLASIITNKGFVFTSKF